MKKLLLFGLYALVLASCQEKKEIDRSEDASKLFRESALILKEITQKIAEAPDSMTIDSLRDLYEKKITTINFSFPPETDLSVTEQDNDSLFTLIKKMKETTEERLLQLKNKKDSCENSKDTLFTAI